MPSQACHTRHTQAMVSSLLIDTLQNPTRSIIELFDPAYPIDDFPARVNSHFTDIFKTLDAFQEARKNRLVFYLVLTVCTHRYPL